MTAAPTPKLEMPAAWERWTRRLIAGNGFYHPLLQPSKFIGRVDSAEAVAEMKEVQSQVLLINYIFKSV